MRAHLLGVTPLLLGCFTQAPTASMPDAGTGENSSDVVVVDAPRSPDDRARVDASPLPDVTVTDLGARRRRHT